MLLDAGSLLIFLLINVFMSPRSVGSMNALRKSPGDARDMSRFFFLPTSHRLLLYCYCCAVIFRLPLRNVLLFLVFLICIPVFSMLLARLLLCFRSCLLLLSLPYSRRPVRLPSSGNCTIFCTPVTIILSLNPIRPPVHGQQHETPAT